MAMTSIVAVVVATLVAMPSHAQPTIVPPSPRDLPTATLPPGTPLENHDVVLVLTIAPDGSVTDVTLKSGVGAPWDDAALAVARRFTFSPATSDGVPSAVTVPLTYSFRKPAAPGRPIPERNARRDIEPAPGFIFAGEVVEKGTRTPQAGVPVVVRDKATGDTWEALTDNKGVFIVYGLPKGRLSLDIFTGGFDPRPPHHLAKDLPEAAALVLGRALPQLGAAS